MFGRIFGRSKDQPEAAVCALCGRTLLAGEWTRRVTDKDGVERLACSLCGPDFPLDDDFDSDFGFESGAAVVTVASTAPTGDETNASAPESTLVDDELAVAVAADSTADGAADEVDDTGGGDLRLDNLTAGLGGDDFEDAAGADEPGDEHVGETVDEPAGATATAVAGSDAASSDAAALPPVDDDDDEAGDDSSSLVDDVRIGEFERRLERIEASMQRLLGEVAVLHEASLRAPVAAEAASVADAAEPVAAAAPLATEAAAAEIVAAGDEAEDDHDVVELSAPAVVDDEPAAASVEAAADDVDETTDPSCVDCSEPGERTWGETPADFAALLQERLAAESGDAASPVASAEPEGVSEDDAHAASVDELDDTSGEDLRAAEVAEPEAANGSDSDLALESDVTDEAIDDADDGKTVVVAPPAAAEVELDVSPDATQTFAAVGMTAPDEEDELGAGESPVAAVSEPPAQVDAASADEDEADEDTAAVAMSAEEIEAARRAAEAEVAALALIQRGVDLFNVSSIPHRVAETCEQLGTAEVFADPRSDELVVVTFQWSMGWYRYNVALDSGEVELDSRGYDIVRDMAPNAEARPDGTIHLAPAQISPAAAQRMHFDEASGRVSAESHQGDGPESARTAAQKPPEILSKSLLGQRSDDQVGEWETTRARDFDWER